VDAALLANYDGVGVIPFLLPAIPIGKELKEVSFSVNLESPSATWGTLNCDLYGLDARSVATVLSTDFFVGDYDTDGSATAIQDDFIPNAAVVGTINSDAGGNANLKTFIQAQYDNGKAGEYIFLRINPDVAFVTTYLRINVSSADVSTASFRPKMTIVFEDGATAGLEDVEKNALNIYPNPITNGKLNISLEGFNDEANLQIYSILGKLVQSEVLKLGTRNSYQVDINLAPGLYIVKLNNGEASKSQKLIVQ
jgi:hypothetical protein